HPASVGVNRTSTSVGGQRWAATIHLITTRRGGSQASTFPYVSTTPSEQTSLSSPPRRVSKMRVSTGPRLKRVLYGHHSAIRLVKSSNASGGSSGTSIDWRTGGTTTPTLQAFPVRF